MNDAYEHDNRDETEEQDERDGFTAADIQNGLESILESLPDLADDEEDDLCALADIARGMADSLPGLKRIKTYKQEQMLTNDAGLLLVFEDGSEFQVTIIQSRRAR